MGKGKKAVTVSSGLGGMSETEFVESLVESNHHNAYDSWMAVVHDLLSCTKRRIEKALEKLPVSLLAFPPDLPSKNTLKAIGPKALSIYTGADEILTILEFEKLPRGTEAEREERREKVEKAKRQLDEIAKIYEWGIAADEIKRRAGKLEKTVAEICQMSGVPGENL